MYQDKDGYMWFGTYDGLNLFNGKNTIVYRFEPDNPLSLSSNIIHYITEAEIDHLWISTSMGLNKMSLKDREIVESYPQYGEARLITSDREGNTLLITKNEFISCYLPELKTIRDVFKPGMKPDSVCCLFTGYDERFYLLDKHAELWDIELDKTNLPLTLSNTKRVIHPKALLTAFPDKESLFFVDVEGKLYQYDLKENSSVFLADLSSLLNRYGSSIGNIVWYGEHLYLAIRGAGLVKIEKGFNGGSGELLIDIGIYCISPDRNQDLLWVGTDGEGVYMHYQKQELFGNVLLDHLPVSIRKPVRSLYTDEKGEVWIGTKGDGIVRIKNYAQYDGRNIPASEVTHYTTADGLSNNQVFCFLKSKYRDLMWIGTQGPGLSYYSPVHDQIITVQGRGDRKIQRVHSITEVNDSTLWVATAGDGLLEILLGQENGRLNIKRKTGYFFESNGNSCNEFHSMSYDGDSLLMIGSRGGYGVIRFNIYTKEYEFLSLLRMENSAIGDVLSVHQSRDSVYYFGASSGLTRVWFREEYPPLVRLFDKNSGIVNDMIHGILEDEEQCLWLSTNKGLARYNPYNDFFHNYSFPDLKVIEFSDDAYSKCAYTGKLLFGGINGFVWVDVSQYIPPTYKPKLRFFQMRVGNESTSLNRYNDEAGKTLEIPPGVSVFSLSFIATDYIEGDNYEYSYQLENYTTRWISLQKNNEITFTNLPAGKYILKVRYKNDVFDSDSLYYSLPVYILPPWYLSRTAWSLYGVIVFLLILLAVWILKQKIAERQARITQRIKEEQKEKLYESKLNFFTNITHELCTPLTLINGINEHIRSYATHVSDEGLRKYTDILSENVKGLNELITEILDFRKIEESGFTHFHIKTVFLSEVLRKQCESYLPVARDNEIEYLITIPESLEWNTDPAYLKKIVSNLLSNAFKYTPRQGKIHLTVYKENEHLFIKVYNTGEGIEESILDTIFDRYRILENLNENMYTEQSSRNGLGLFICRSLVKALQGEISVQSQYGVCAQFTVSLPYLESGEVAGNPQSFVEFTSPLPSLPEVPEENKIEDPGDKPIVLVIDDNKDILWLVSKQLSPYYTVKEAHHVREAFLVLEKILPSLIITDIIMPDVNGLEFITRLKSDKFTKHIPVVVISAKISDAEQAEGINMGADAYLPKPFSPQLLLSVVNRLITNKKELKDYFYSPESAYDYKEGQVVHQEDRQFLDEVTKIINDNLEKESLRPELIADELGINTRNLYRRFKKISSLSPSDFIKDYRFTHAAKLLVTTNLHVQEIIYKVGINNKSYFYREFLKKYGVTPKEYRKSPLNSPQGGASGFQENNSPE
ncbi:MAG: helix-turn-helix domain-containing protein [Tannerellaceae bacterium]|nr:helix-turn-helix domain-containing protein [Tannerellaceae bacterium]